MWMLVKVRWYPKCLLYNDAVLRVHLALLWTPGHFCPTYLESIVQSCCRHLAPSCWHRRRHKRSLPLVIVTRLHPFFPGSCPAQRPSSEDLSVRRLYRLLLHPLFRIVPAHPGRDSRPVDDDNQRIGAKALSVYCVFLVL